METGRSPLPSAALYILISIGPGERHGYGIMQEIARISEGSVRIGPGTLYTTIKRLLAAGLIEETASRPDPELDDHRRRYYRLTNAGWALAAAEMNTMSALLRSARSWASHPPR